MTTAIARFARTAMMVIFCIIGAYVANIVWYSATETAISQTIRPCEHDECDLDYSGYRCIDPGDKTYTDCAVGPGNQSCTETICP